MTDMIRVRIAVLVTEKGIWAASGSNEEDYEGYELELSSLEATGKSQIHFVEADIPLPVHKTIEGIVTSED